MSWFIPIPFYPILVWSLSLSYFILCFAEAMSFSILSYHCLINTLFYTLLFVFNPYPILLFPIRDTYTILSNPTLSKPYSFVSYSYLITILFLSYSYLITILFFSYFYIITILFLSYSYLITILFLSYSYLITILFLSYSYLITILFLSYSYPILI